MTLKDPPDPGNSNQQFQTPKMHGPKYLVMTRTNKSDEQDTLMNVSPFLIKKVIDGACNGEVEMCKKTRNGSILIKTKTYEQAIKILQITSLSQGILVEVCEHKTLNFTKGVIYSNDLRGISEEEILSEMKTQNVSEIKKILKKTENKLIETGLVIMTFSTLSLPAEVYIGYEKVHVRPFIPTPLRCNNCYIYGHLAKFCKNEKLCYNCGKTAHTDVEKKEVCKNQPECSNCKFNKICPDNHSVTSKKCPIFVKKQEIQAIKTTQNVDMKTAVSIYNSRHQQPHLFSTIVASQPNPTSLVNPKMKDNNDSAHPQRKPITYSDINTESDSELSNKSPISTLKSDTSKFKNVKIFPRSLSQRAKNQLKVKSKTQVASTAPVAKRTYISNTKEYSFDEEEGMEQF